MQPLLYSHASIWDDADIAANVMFLDFDKRKKDDMIHSVWVEYAWIIWSNYGLAING